MLIVVSLHGFHEGGKDRRCKRCRCMPSRVDLLGCQLNGLASTLLYYPIMLRWFMLVSAPSRHSVAYSCPVYSLSDGNRQAVPVVRELPLARPLDVCLACPVYDYTTIRLYDCTTWRNRGRNRFVAVIISLCCSLYLHLISISRIVLLSSFK